MKLGILGGTFDPVHTGHLIIAECARELLGLEKVFFVPAGNPPHRQPPVAPAEHRCRMVGLAIEGNPVFAVSDIEVKRKGPSYTYDTVCALLEREGPQAELTLIVGADAFQELASWYKIKELAGLVTFAVAGREGAETPPDLPGKVRIQRLKNGFFPVSSREIRSRIKSGRSIRYLVPDPVREYINRNRLYR